MERQGEGVPTEMEKGFTEIVAVAEKVVTQNITVHSRANQPVLSTLKWNTNPAILYQTPWRLVGKIGGTSLDSSSWQKKPVKLLAEHDDEIQDFKSTTAGDLWRVVFD